MPCRPSSLWACRREFGRRRHLHGVPVEVDEHAVAERLVQTGKQDADGDELGERC